MIIARPRGREAVAHRQGPARLGHEAALLLHNAHEPYAARAEGARAEKIERDASFVILRFTRFCMANNVVKRVKKRKVWLMMKWNTMTRGTLDLQLHRAARCIQRGWQKRLYNLNRDKGAAAAAGLPR